MPAIGDRRMVDITAGLSRYVIAWKDSQDLGFDGIAALGVSVGAVMAVCRRSQAQLRRTSFDSLAMVMGHTPDQLFNRTPPPPVAAAPPAEEPAEPAAEQVAPAVTDVEMLTMAGKRVIVLHGDTSDEKMAALGRIAGMSNEQVVHLDNTVRELVRIGMETGINN
jgi:hypothetical protein